MTYYFALSLLLTSTLLLEQICWSFFLVLDSFSSAWSWMWNGKEYGDKNSRNWYLSPGDLKSINQSHSDWDQRWNLRSDKKSFQQFLKMRTLIFVNKQIWIFVDHCFCVFCLWTFQRWSQSIKVQQHTAILKLSEAKVAQKTFWRHIINLRICWAAERGKVEFKTDSYISSDQRKRG